MNKDTYIQTERHPHRQTYTHQDIHTYIGTFRQRSNKHSDIQKSRQIDIKIDRQTDIRHTDIWTDIQIDRHTSRYPDTQTDIQIDRTTSRQTDDNHPDGQTNLQTSRHSDRLLSRKTYT